MEMFLVFSWLLLLTGCDKTHGSSGGFINDNGLTWEGARKSCMDTLTSCDLSVEPPAQQPDFWASIPLKAGSSYWVGASRMEILQWNPSKTPLIEKLGCYQKPHDLKTNVRAINKNGPERCLTQCDGNYVALQGKTCYCVDENMVSSFGQQQPEEQCHINCYREGARCGGTDYISVYNIPDQTVLERRGKSKQFFWTLSHNNMQELILFTNRPGKKKSKSCVSPSNVFSTVDLGKKCPADTEAMSFEGVNVMQFLASMSKDSIPQGVFFGLPLGVSRRYMWLNGEAMTTVSGTGICVAITYDGQKYSLVKRICKDRLPSVCSCFGHTFTTEATTEQTTITTTTQMTTPPPEPETTTPLAPQTSQIPQTTTFAAETSTYAPTTTSPSGEEATSSGMNTTTMVSGSSTWAVNASSFNATGQEGNKDDELLFPFEDMDGDGLSRTAHPARPDQSLSDDKPASGAASLGVIIGSAIGVAVVLVLVIIVVIVIRRQGSRQQNASLLKDKAKPAAGRVNYPI